MFGVCVCVCEGGLQIFVVWGDCESMLEGEGEVDLFVGEC